MRNGSTHFYGWRIVGVALLCQFVSTGFLFYSFGVFFKPIAGELGGSRFAVSFGLTAANIAAALVAPLIGRAVERGSARRVTIGGAVACAVGYGLLSLSGALWQLYLVLALLVGAGSTALGNIPQGTLVARWFHRRRGTALGVSTVGVSLSGLLMPALATLLIAELGWRASFRIYAVATLVLIPVVALVVVDRPEDMGLLPDGDGAAVETEPLSWRTRDILRSRAFWCISVAFALALFSVSAILTHLVPFLTDHGLDPLRAASLLSLTAGCGIAGKVAFGRVADAADGRTALWLSLAAQLAGVLLLMGTEGTLLLSVAAMLFGFGMGGVVPLQATLTAVAFGPEAFPRASGLMRPVMLPVSASGVALAGLLFDRFGDYRIAFVTFAVAFVLSGVATALLPVTARR